MKGQTRTKLAAADGLRTPERCVSPQVGLETGSVNSRTRWSPRMSPNMRRRSPYASLNASPEDSAIASINENDAPFEVESISSSDFRNRSPFSSPRRALSCFTHMIRRDGSCSPSKRSAGSPSRKSRPSASNQEVDSSNNNRDIADTDEQINTSNNDNPNRNRNNSANLCIGSNLNTSVNTSMNSNNSDNNGSEDSRDRYVQDNRDTLRLVSTVFPQEPEENFEEMLERRMRRLEEESYTVDQDQDQRSRRLSDEASAFFMPTNLHHICSNSDTIQELLTSVTSLTRQKGVKRLSSYASKTDGRGRTPMHLLSQNEHLAESIEVYRDIMRITKSNRRRGAYFDQDSKSDEQVIDFVVHELLPYYPGAMMIRDDAGHIPFQGVLISWVKSCHGNANTRHFTTDTHQRAPLLSQFPKATSTLSQVLESTSASMISVVRAAGKNLSRSASEPGLSELPSYSASYDMEEPPLNEQSEQVESESPEGPDQRQSNIPRDVQLSPFARYALVMLSAIVDQVGSESGPDGRRSRPQDERLSELRATGTQHKSFQDLYGSIDISDTIIQTIASIPNLVKTMLLIDDEDDREFALSTSVMQRVMMCEHSIGPWMTSMLQSKHEHVSDRVVEHLRRLSDLSQQDRTKSSKTTGRSTSTSSFSADFNDGDGIAIEISRLPGFVPSLLSLGNTGVEEVATMEMVRKVLDKMISRPFAVTVIFCDIVFLIVLLYGFRAAVDQLISGGSIESVLQWIYVANIGIFYFLIREIGKIVSLCLVAKRVRRYFLSFWNLTDLLAALLALASTVYMRNNFTQFDKTGADDDFLRGLLAVTTGMLWLRVLSVMKAVNMQLATFVLAILNISRDIIWFCVILFTMVVSFAQMFYTLLTPTSCANTSGTDGQPQCKQSEYYLRAYSVLLGDFGLFDRDDFESSFSIFVMVLYSFLVTVVLLNVLIAVASDSYEKCLIRSQHLFGRARVMLIAELVSFQHLLSQKDNMTVAGSNNGYVFNSWWLNGAVHQNFTRGSMLFFGLSLTVVVGWAVAETVGYASGEQYGNLWWSLSSVIVNVALFIAIIFFLLNAGTSKDYPDQESVNRKHCFCSTHWLHRCLQSTMLRLLGSSRDAGKPSKFDAYDWKGRVHYLQAEMERLASESAERERELSSTLEGMIQSSEARLHAQMNDLHHTFDSGNRTFVNPIDQRTMDRDGNTVVSLTVDELRKLMTPGPNGGEHSTVSSVRLNAVQSPNPTEIGLNETTFVKYDG